MLGNWPSQSHTPGALSITLTHLGSLVVLESQPVTVLCIIIGHPRFFTQIMSYTVFLLELHVSMRAVCTRRQLLLLIFHS